MSDKKTNPKLTLAIKIVLGRDVQSATSEGIAALVYLIDLARILLRRAEDDLAKKVAPPKRYMTASPKIIARQRQREKAAAIALTLYDSVLIQNKSVGNLWYSELEAMRSESAFAASLADQLLRHGAPTVPTRVRDLVNQKTLALMVKKAKADAEKSAPQKIHAKTRSRREATQTRGYENRIQ